MVLQPIYHSDATCATKYRSITRNSHIGLLILSRRSGVMTNYHSDAAFITTRHNITITPTNIVVLQPPITVITRTQSLVVILPATVMV